jgi:hypothetical protein
VPAKFDTTAEALVGDVLYMQGIAFEVIGVLEKIGQVGW